MNRTPYLQDADYVGFPVGEAPAPAAEKPKPPAKKPVLKEAAAKRREKKTVASK